MMSTTSWDVKPTGLSTTRMPDMAFLIPDFPFQSSFCINRPPRVKVVIIFTGGALYRAIGNALRVVSRTRFFLRQRAA